MPCYSPLRAFKIGYNEKTLAPKYKICGSYAESVYFRNGKWNINGYKIRPEEKFPYDYVNEYIEIPCGKCIGCREDQARQWTDRIVMELASADSAYFITLTYADEFLHYVGYPDPDTGELLDIPTLKYKDCQDFIKQLRNTGQKIRYFAAGEYGEKSARPHYHMIVFNLKLDDLEFYRNNFEGDAMYNSKYLTKLWGKGFVVVGEVNKKTAGYTARYVLKKYVVDPDYYDKYGIEPESCRASKRPALGREFLEKNAEKFARSSKIAVYADGVADMVSLPKYGKRLYKQLNLCQDILEEKSSENQRLLAQKRKENEKITNMDYRKQLEMREIVKKDALKALKRDL